MDALSLPWRTGRHNDRIVYAQAGPEPSDDDVMVAVFFASELAAAAVKDHNGRAAEPPPKWTPITGWSHSGPCPPGCTCNVAKGGLRV